MAPAGSSEPTRTLALRVPAPCVGRVGGLLGLPVLRAGPEEVLLPLDGLAPEELLSALCAAGVPVLGSRVEPRARG